MPLISPMVMPTPLIAAIASLVAAWISLTWAAISPVAWPVWVARPLTSLATTAKPRPASPALRRLDGSVERQQIGLRGDAADQVDDAFDRLRGRIEAGDPRVRALRFIDGAAGDLGRLAHALGDAAYRNRQLLGRRGNRVHIIRGVGRVLDHGSRALGDITREIGGLVRLGADRACGGNHRLDERAGLAVESAGDSVDAFDAGGLGGTLHHDAVGQRGRLDRALAQFFDGLRHPADLVVAPARRHGKFPIAPGKLTDHFGEDGDRPNDAAAEQHGNTGGDGDDQPQQPDCQPQRERACGAVTVRRGDRLDNPGIAHRENGLHRIGILQPEIARLDAVDTVGTAVLVEHFVEFAAAFQVALPHDIERCNQPRPVAGTRDRRLDPEPGLVDAPRRLGILLHGGGTDRLSGPERGTVDSRAARTESAHLPPEASNADEA